MSDHQPHPSWWQASDLQWYPPELHPQLRVPAGAVATPTGPTVVGDAGDGPDRVAKSWARGAEGERTTERALFSLGPHYTVVHGLKTGRTGSDIDHVVIGPTGVWVVDSKHWSAPAEVRSGELRCGRYSRTSHVEAVERQAALVRERLGVDAAPMLCFVGELLPRPAMMVGRVRLVTTGTIAEHIKVGTITLGEDDLRAVLARARSWKERPQQFLPKPAPPSAPVRSRPRRASGRPSVDLSRPSRVPTRTGVLRRFGIAAVLVMGIALVVTNFDRLSRHAEERVAAAPTSSPESAPATAPGPGYLRVVINCPEPTGGYELAGVVSLGIGGPRRVRISSTVNGEPRYLGEFGTYQHTPPIVGIAPGASTGFDVQSVDDAGQGGDSYHVDIVTPAVPC